MDLKQQIFTRLKPKAKGFGFNKKEMMGIAAKIADNLNLEEDALEEDVNAAIDEQIDAVIPYLQFAQAQANRVIEANRKQVQEHDDEGEDDTKDGASASTKTTKTSGDEMPAWFKAFAEKTEAQFKALQVEKTSSSRKARLEAILKDTGAFGSRTLKSFAKMSFESDDDFEEFLTEVQEDLKSLNQERANAGLQSLGKVPSFNETKKEEPFSDDIIDRMADNF